MKTVIVGGVAAGASTGARLRRLDESAEIVLNSDPMPFIRGDEAEEAWRIIDPAMKAAMKAWPAGDVPMQEYPADQEDHAVGGPEGTIPETDKANEDRRGGR
jgi:NADPH-dependent 2,4-dienoyl-CoA reductase/sulfur reductase-like enzyme